MPRIATFPLVLALAALLLASCANKEPEVDFKPIQLNWHALSEAAENHPEKDACVISVTSLLMREKAVRESNTMSCSISRAKTSNLREFARIPGRKVPPSAGLLPFAPVPKKSL